MQRVLFALAAMGVCLVLTVLVIGATIAALLLLGAAFVAAPLVILFFGTGPLSGRISFARRRRRDDGVIDV